MMVSKQRFPFALLVLGLLMLTSSRNAAAGDEALAACVGEIQRVCAQMEDHIENCLAAHGAEMTPVCRAQLASAIDLMQSPAGPSVCVADVQRVCASLTADALASCMNAKRAEFSSACQKYLQGAAQAGAKQ